MHVRISTYFFLVVTLFVVGPVLATHHDMSDDSMQGVSAASSESQEMGSQEEMDCDMGHCPSCISESGSNVPEHGCGICFEIDVPGSSTLILPPDRHQSSSRMVCRNRISGDNPPISQDSDPPYGSYQGSPKEPRFCVLRL